MTELTRNGNDIGVVGNQHTGKVAFKVFSFKVPRNMRISTVSAFVRLTAV